MRAYAAQTELQAARGRRPRRRLAAAFLVPAALLVMLAGGCGLSRGAKPSGETKGPPDSPAGLRQEVESLRADVADLRSRVEAAQRAGTDHADRVAQETRSEFDAVQRAMEASSRNDMQRQVEVLDAQARRIDLLEKRAGEMGQTLRRVELSLGGIESQLARILDGASAPPPGARSGSPARSSTASSAPRAADDAGSSASTPESATSPTAAGAGLTPPAMLGPSRPPKTPPPAAPAPPPAAQTEFPERPRVDNAPPPVAKRSESPPAAAPAQSPSDSTPRVAKAAPPATDAKAAPIPERAPATGLPRSSKVGTAAASPAAGALTPRALFERGMESWSKGEQGQAVLDFEELVHTYPTDPLAASAQFRIGEAYYAARDFERAALEYRKAVDLAPKGKDTPQALLRLGLAYRAQKRESDARQAWNQLVRDFPESDSSEEARRALRGR